jgi:hypothetical protein
MPTLNESASFSAPGGFVGALKTFANEAAELAQALLSPGKILDEVEQMRALHVEANRIEIADPLRAAQLRRRASGIGLR